jgi:hypothetical protein
MDFIFTNNPLGFQIETLAVTREAHDPSNRPDISRTIALQVDASLARRAAGP